MTRFSVIVPVYNIQDYISKCITSILDQTFRNFELIIVDDGSTDGSGLTCDDLTDKDSRITVIHKKNGGLSDARNAGIAKSKGEYIIFIDGDDYIEPRSFERIDIEIISSREPDILITRLKEVFPDSKPKFKDRNWPKSLVDDKNKVIEWIFKGSDNTWPSVRYVVKKSLIKNKGLEFAEGFIHEDIDWTSNLFLHARSFGFLDYYWYNHRMDRDGSIGNTLTVKSITDVIKLVSNNVKDIKFNVLQEQTKVDIFERMVKSVFYKLGDYKHLNRNEKEKVIALLNQNKDIFIFTKKFQHRVFVLFCGLFGFRAGLLILGLRKAKQHKAFLNIPWRPKC